MSYLFEHKNTNFLDVSRDDIDDFADEFGLKVKCYRNNFLDCEVSDDKKFMLFKIKYGL